MEKRAVKRSVIISAMAPQVWKALTDPDLIKQYLFGASVKTDWKEGNPIIFSGIWKEKPYEDKGKIISICEKKSLEYTHWSSLWNTEDIPENYFSVIYELEERENDTVLTVTQVGLMSENSYELSAQNWEAVLQRIKELVEKEVAATQTVS